MDVMEEVRGLTDEEVAIKDKEEAEAKVVAKGVYEGIIYTWNEVDDSKKNFDDPYKGHPIYRAGVRVFDYPEVGKTQIAWVKFSGARVTNEKGNEKAPTLAARYLKSAVHMPDASIVDALEQGKVTRALYTIETWDKADPNDSTKKVVGGNWCKKVKKL